MQCDYSLAASKAGLKPINSHLILGVNSPLLSLQRVIVETFDDDLGIGLSNTNFGFSGLFLQQRPTRFGGDERPVRAVANGAMIWCQYGLRLLTPRSPNGRF